MATIGFLLAPLREIPTSRDEKWMKTVQSWIDIADRAWKDWNESGRSAPVPVVDAAAVHEGG